MNKSEITPALQYFFKKLERKSEEVRQHKLATEDKKEIVPFDEVERFARAIMTQNIFIHTVGVNGKPESTILTKAMFSINKVVRLYYSTSLDEDRQGYLRIHPDRNKQLIVVERLHGFRPKPEILYASLDECHVIRFFVGWLMRRIDWEKTKIDNLDLYKKFVDLERKALEEAIAAEEAEKQEAQLQQTLDKHFKGKQRIPSSRVK
ncbi:hypothetical protein GHNINEIG_00346 [Hydrogenovibrio crunogenus]|uniref:Uncharacterized protein n=1 Tax=Hydrogenovibrio crunogenus TaxID=39765 RepID=A0A4P7NXP2_9GAMM|nr:hypothetical protein [Hydrogenovibrio crunogenus]QBZ82318.1 hypothetical protein GHNINEIG_00346 [Hydrogenovibrio crunogenus]RUM91564.1 MAG: hypothetical protein DSZ27_05885 [Thiomicrospira sp.]